MTYPCSVSYSLDTQLAYPHYSDPTWDYENTIFGAKADNLHYNYDDRLRQFDYAKHKKGEEKAKNINRNTARYWLEYLKGYYEKDIDLQWIGAGSNRSNGYPFWVFGYIILEPPV